MQWWSLGWNERLKVQSCSLVLHSHCRLLRGLSFKVRAARLHSMGRSQGLTVTDMVGAFFLSVKYSLRRKHQITTRSCLIPHRKSQKDNILLPFSCKVMDGKTRYLPVHTVQHSFILLDDSQIWRRWLSFSSVKLGNFNVAAVSNLLPNSVFPFAYMLISHLIADHERWPVNRMIRLHWQPQMNICQFAATILDRA